MGRAFHYVLRKRILSGPLLLLLACAGCDTPPQPLPSHGAASWEYPGAKTNAVEPAAPVAEATAQPITPVPTLNQQGDVPPSAPAPKTNASLSAVPGHRGKLVSLREWSQAAGWSNRLDTVLAVPRLCITSTNGSLTVYGWRPVAQWNGVDVHLGYAPQVVHNQVYAEAADVRYTIGPLLLGQALRPGKGVIVLDPGHGGADSGARSTLGGREKDYTLDWACRLQALLLKDGWKVLMTRTNDTEVALSNRVAVADAAGADLFLSLHFNSTLPDKSGLETYCLTPAGMPSTLTRGYADELDLVLPNNSFDAQNLAFAMRLHAALLPQSGEHDRGVRRARFPAVLRTQQRPAVLIEGGYLSNSAEARSIAQPDYRQKLAVAIETALLPIAPGTAAR